MRQFLPFLLLLFIVAAVVRSEAFFSIAYLFFFAYVLSRLYLDHVTRRLSLQRRFVDHAYFDDEVDIEVIARNGSRLPLPWLELHESLPMELAAPPFRRAVLTLKAKGQHHFHYTVQCRKRGCYPIGALSARTGDALGLLETRTLTHPPDRLTVYPKIIPLKQMRLPTRSPLVALPARSPLFEDPARVVGVRHYQPGDALSRIHWSASASAGELLIKQYQPSIARETVIALDLSEAGYARRGRLDALELAVTTAASIANHVSVRERLPVGLITEGLDALTSRRTRFSLPPRRERGHLITLLEVLARVHLAEAAPLSAVLRQEAVRLAWGATFVLITGDGDAGLFPTIAHLRRTGFAVTLIQVQPGRLAADWRQQAAILGVPLYTLWTEAELEAVFG